MLHLEEIGTRIACWRKKRGLSQAALAQALSVSPQAVSNWERGQSLPDIETLLELSHLFDISLHAILEVQHIDSLSTAPKCPPDLPADQARLLAPVCSCFSSADFRINDFLAINITPFPNGFLLFFSFLNEKKSPWTD